MDPIFPDSRYVSSNPAVEMLIIFCYDYKHLSFSNKPYQPEINFIENKYLTGLLMSCPGLLPVTLQQSSCLNFWTVA